VFFFCPLKKKRSFVICFDLQFEEVTKKGFTDSKRPWTLESVSNTTREASNGNPRETCSDLYNISYSAQ
jgi:hypothetical protein